MSKARRSWSLVPWIERALGALAQWTFGHPWLALALVVLLTAGSVQVARGLQLDTDLTGLLPATFPSVRELGVVKEQLGGGGYVVVLARGVPADAVEPVAEALAERLGALEEVQYVDYKKPTGFFEDRAFYYMSVEDLEEVHTRLARRVKWERQRNNPLFVDLGTSPRPELDFSDLEARYRGELERSGIAASPEGSPYYTDARTGTVALLVKPRRLASDLAYAEQVVGEVEGVLAGWDSKPYGDTIKFDITGRYKKRLDQQARLQADLSFASLAALVLTLAFLAFHFRRFAAVVWVLTPLLVGLTWTFGFAELAFDRLNILTAFIGSILLGLGVDHGIHLLGRYEVERARQAEAAEAIRSTFAQTGRAVAVAALTTIVAFLGISISEFKAFREFGIIAAAGMGLVVVSYTALLPALLGVAERMGWRPRVPPPARPSSYKRMLERWAPTLLWCFAWAAFWFASQASEVTFNSDFGALEDSQMASFRYDREVNALLGRSQTPMVILASSAEEERQVVEALRARKAERGADSRVSFVASLADLVPGEQAAHREVLDAMEETLSRVKAKWLEPEDRERFERLMVMTRAQPFARRELPVEVRRSFESPRGDVAAVLIFASGSLSDGDEILALSKEVREVTLPSGQVVSATGESMVLADILEMVIRESPVVFGVTLLLVFACLWLLMGSLRLTLLCLLPTGATLAVTLGLLPEIGLQLNFLNVIMIPVLLGIAVDGGVHLVTRLEEDKETPLPALLEETARGIVGAVLTTALGFGAMILADHPGLASLGELAVLGLAVNLLACLLGLAALLALLPQRQRFAAWPWKARLSAWISTVGMAGLSPVAPGTLGALLALPVAWLLAPLPLMVRVALVLALTLVAIAAAEVYVTQSGEDDPQVIVSDELVGCLWALVFVPAWGWGWALLGFGLFRLFDIWKPGPIGMLDDRLHGGLGVVLDDVAAGLLAGAVLAGLRLLIEFM